jgi:hypothetical protein
VRRAALVVISVLLVVAVVAVGAAVARDTRPRSPVVYPLQTIPLSFSHARHLERDAGLACAACHAAATTSTSAADDLMPPEAACAAAGCHAIDRAAPSAKACGRCHPGWSGQGQPPRIVAPAPHLVFNHEIHEARGVACATCHGDLAKQGVGLATRMDLPVMATCLASGCHDGKKATARCAACHPRQASGRLVTEFPEGKLVPSGSLRADDHDERFRLEHARAAQDTAYCDSCHTRAFCVDCHDGTVKPMDFHAGDYARRHAVDAKRNDPDCGSCHRAQSFCTGCHARTGITPDARTGTFAPGRATAPYAPFFHPADWSAVDDGAGSHAAAARKNLRACASCHREEFCTGCHADRSGAGLAPSPHGARWRGSDKCRAIESKNPRLCLKCHLEGRTCDE